MYYMVMTRLCGPKMRRLINEIQNTCFLNFLHSIQDGNIQPFGLPLRSSSHLSGDSKDSLQAYASATDCQLHTARVEVK
jgi:hypothetical protein